MQMEAGTTKDVCSLLNVDIYILCRFRCRESLRLFKTLAPLNSMSPATNKLAYIIFGFPQVWPFGYANNVGIMVPRTPLTSSGVTSSLRSWKFSSSHHYPYTLNIHYIGQSRGLHHSPNVTFLINVLCSLNCTLLLKDRGQTSSYSKWNVVNQA